MCMLLRRVHIIFEHDCVHVHTACIHTCVCMHVCVSVYVHMCITYAYECMYMNVCVYVYAPCVCVQCMQARSKQILVGQARM